MQSGPYVKRVLSSSRWMAAARPATGMPLLQPVLTPQPSLSYSTMGSVERARLAICSAKAGGPCGRTAPSPGESGQGEHVHDLDREPLASGKLYPPLTRTVARARGHHPLALRRASPPHDMPQRALVRHGPATAARLPLLSPAQESTVTTCCPRPLHSFRREARIEPS